MWIDTPEGRKPIATIGAGSVFGEMGMLTGEPSNGIFGGVSVDQYLAQKLTTSAPFKSIELGVLTDIWGAQNQTRMSYTAPGVFASPQPSRERHRIAS